MDIHHYRDSPMGLLATEGDALLAATSVFENGSLPPRLTIETAVWAVVVLTRSPVLSEFSKLFCVTKMRFECSRPRRCRTSSLASTSIGKMSSSLSDRRRWDRGLLQMTTNRLQSTREFRIIPAISIATMGPRHGSRPNIVSNADISNSAMIITSGRWSVRTAYI